MALIGMIVRRTRPARSIPCLTVALLLTIPATAPAQSLSSGRSPWEGREVFREKGCIQCHAVYGQGGGPGPDLGKRKVYGTYLELAARMWNHFPRMWNKMQKTGYLVDDLTSEEMDELVHYLAYLRYMREPGNEVRGRKLLDTMGCRKCHSFGGRGGEVGPDITGKREYLSPIRLAEAMWNHGPQMLETSQEQHVKRPRFRGDDIVDLATAISSYMTDARIPVNAYDLGDPAQGEDTCLQKGCFYCHSFRGHGGSLGPTFEEVALDYSVTQIAGRMWNHGPRMWEAMRSENISFPSFEAGEMADVIAYLYGLKLEDEPGDSTKGRALLRDKKCLDCHSVRGRGGTLGKDLMNVKGLDSPVAMMAAMWNHASDMRKKQKEKGLRWPRLSSRDMADLFAYLQEVSAVYESQ